MAKRIRRRTLKRNRKSIRSHKRRHTKKRTQTRNRNYKHKKHSFRRRHRKQYGGDFSKEQIEQIKRAMRDNDEHFTEEKIDEYMAKLNDMSQFLLRGDEYAYEHFYNHMIDHLSNDSPQTFQEWIDENYTRFKEGAETDPEIYSFSDMEDSDADENV